MTQNKSALHSDPAVADPVAVGRESTPGMVPQIQDHIGRQLRAVYDEVLNQPVPDRFKELMDKLDEKLGDQE
ncbi:hypothetical protein GCM10007036_34790 [Alsobacter metallidurans]|uniref:Anti-sigma factor NepR domain-containing protein n=1 Tax=Alsobacter metallidurans TaxID=340221 RepID=A0A917IAK4_9HYPH|nr:NepR family anti-sigma factor [Alsobacter metallidurans]GGH26753.1 hypothetical protein GCM10007036_34790 [Alsobacter metallidurans]